jgi:hypothetical protein
MADRSFVVRQHRKRDHQSESRRPTDDVLVAALTGDNFDLLLRHD